MLGGMDLYDALIHTFGSVGTGGLSTYNDSVGHFDSLYINVVITVFMILCGMNFNLFFMSFRNGIRTLIDDFELRFYMLIFIAVSMIIFATLMITGTYTSVKTALSDSFFQVASILTTTGYSTADYETWPLDLPDADIHAHVHRRMFIINGRRSESHKDRGAPETDKTRYIHEAPSQCD